MRSIASEHVEQVNIARGVPRQDTVSAVAMYVVVVGIAVVWIAVVVVRCSATVPGVVMALHPVIPDAHAIAELPEL